MSFCLVPKFVHFAERHVLQWLAHAYAMLFNVVESAYKLRVGLLKSCVGIYLIQTSGIDEREEEVAELLS